MTLCFFVSDLHGNKGKYKKLFHIIKKDMPKLVFMGGDLLPSVNFIAGEEIVFIDYFTNELIEIKQELKNNYPNIYLILGNDDARIYEEYFIENKKDTFWNYIHNKMVVYEDYHIYGYSCIPPTPFLLKDWEKYDISVYIDPGCVHPTEGYRSVKTNEDIKNSTIQKDLEELTRDEINFHKTIFLFHSPPYETYLDRAALDGKMIDHVPLDVHVGSIAIKKFINKNQPYITLHGHVHESSSITGYWQEQIKSTFAFSGCYDGAELVVVKFYLEDPANAWREIY